MASLSAFLGGQGSELTGCLVSPFPMTSDPSAPRWPYCGHGADLAAGGPVGCRGRSVEPNTSCLAHLADGDRGTYLASLAPGNDVDHRGTEFDATLLMELLDALIDPTTGHARIGEARFDEVTFGCDVSFEGVTFYGEAWFDGATLTSGAEFTKAIFCQGAWFGGATFVYGAEFLETTFRTDAWFVHAIFGGDTRFSGAVFGGDVRFDGAIFDGIAMFFRAAFEKATLVGPLACSTVIDFREASFTGPVVIQAAAAELNCTRTRWESAAIMRLRLADVDLSDAVFEYPLKISSRSSPFHAGDGSLLDESVVTLGDPTVRILSLRGVDCAHLVLSDVDLTECLFSGAVHLDQVRMEGVCPLAQVPEGIRRRGSLPVRWTPRRTLAEEHHWRVARGGAGWSAAPAGTDHTGPASLASVYRQLRKSFEDSKNEPGAADFYYGEMEMRRHDPATPRAERWLLAGYWGLSGYGLRATRALIWLLTAMTVTLLAMMLWGLPTNDPKTETKGRLRGTEIALTAETSAPLNPSGSWHQRLSIERFDKSLQVVFNSVIFRSSGQNLTTTGTYMEMASRLAEPVLLGLALLAIRGRIKR